MGKEFAASPAVFLFGTLLQYFWILCCKYYKIRNQANQVFQLESKYVFFFSLKKQDFHIR